MASYERSIQTATHAGASATKAPAKSVIPISRLSFISFVVSREAGTNFNRNPSPSDNTSYTMVLPIKKFYLVISRVQTRVETECGMDGVVTRRRCEMAERSCQHDQNKLESRFISKQ